MERDQVRKKRMAALALQWYAGRFRKLSRGVGDPLASTEWACPGERGNSYQVVWCVRSR